MAQELVIATRLEDRPRAHFAWTDQETVVQINGVGPFDVIYVNPEDDPRKQRAMKQ